MNLDSLNKWLMLAANVGVIAGIFFLVVEVNQNNELMLAETRMAATGFATDIYGDIAVNNEIAEILLKDRQHEELAEVESIRAYGFWMRAMSAWYMAFNLYPEDELFQTQTSMKENLDTYPSLVTAWEARKNRFSGKFITWVESFR